MRKKFVEPAMHRIELNLRENIATSTQIAMGYYFYVDLWTCNVLTTGKTVFELKMEGTQYLADIYCTELNARVRTMFYRREEVLPYLY